MRLRPLRSTLLCAALLAAGPALAQRQVQLKSADELAQAEKPLEVAPVVVEAATPAELKRQTYAFAESYAAATPRLDRVARWARPVCVAVLGLAPDQAAGVKARLEEVAKALKVGVAKPGCNASVEVFFADAPQGLLDRVAATREDLLGYWHRRDRDSLKTMIRPVQAWYVTATVSAGNSTGMAFAYMDRTDHADGNTNQTNGEMVDDPEVKSLPTGCAESRFGNCMKSVFNHVLIVVDNNRVRDYDAGQMADYVTMLAFAQPRSLEGCNSLPSVIDLFSCRRPEPAKGLTRADVAYLTGLYQANLETNKTSQLSDISGRMANLLLTANKLDRLALQGGGKAPGAR